MNILVFDLFYNLIVDELGGKYVLLDEFYVYFDVIILYCFVIVENYYMLNEMVFNKMKDGVMIINISCGGLIDS